MPDPRPIDPTHAYLPAESVPDWSTLGFVVARMAYWQRHHHAKRDGADWSIDLDARRALRWGETTWTKVEEFSGISSTAVAEPQITAEKPPVERGRIPAIPAPALPEADAGDVNSFIDECLAAGLEIDAGEGQGFDVGNRWMRAPDGRRLLAVVSSRELVGLGFVRVSLTEFAPGPSTPRPTFSHEMSPPPRPHQFSGASRQSSLF